MSAADHLGKYAEGWTKGDASIILQALADDYVFDDPNAGKIAKSELTDYLAGMKEAVRSLRDGSLPEPFLQLTEVLTREDDGVVTAWCWWEVPGTALRGGGLIRVGAEGVRSEVITYYTKLPE